MEVYVCEVCGNMVEQIQVGTGIMYCCGQPMKLVEADAVDAVKEKHVPMVVQHGNCVTVKVGSISHPMLQEHHIEWVTLVTDQGIYRKELHPHNDPEVTFMLCEGEKWRRAYAYCNLHGLWKCEHHSAKE